MITARVGEFGDKALGAEFGEVVAKGSERVAFAGAAKRFEDGINKMFGADRTERRSDDGKSTVAPSVANANAQMAAQRIADAGTTRCYPC